ncbi:MAG TPA: heme exporter protein CcmB [Candidatus Limnocylindrales bacterium]|jgi:heme exporter protein B|nr:heme exporter protein CcmB [Candidatus Limnocylindrales bacterium]
MRRLRSEAGVALAIARKDAIAELRGRHATVSTLFFAAVVLLLFGFALGPDAARLAAAAPGLLWLAVVFAGILAVNRLHLLETDDGAMEQLALYPVPRRAIYAGKALGGFAVMFVLGVVVLGAVGVLFAVDIGSAWLPLLVTVVLGALGIAAVGTFYAGVTVRLRAREVMLPLLMLPILAPLLLGAVKATVAALTGDPFGELGAWLQLLIAFDLIMLVAGAATYGFLLED